MSQSQKLLDVILVIDYLYKLQELKESCDLSNLIFLIYLNGLIDEEKSGKPELLGDDVLKVEGSKFTSKELDDETNLYNFGFRMYDPKTSRWMSNDPMMDGAEIGLSTYTYCQNKPLLYKDPNGLAVFNPNGDSSMTKDKFTGHGNQDTAITDFNKSQEPFVKSTPVTPSNRRSTSQGKSIAPPLNQKESPDYDNNCLIWTITNEVISAGGKLNEGYTRQKLMDDLQNNARYSSEKTADVINKLFSNVKVSVFTLTGSEAQDLILRNNIVTENSRLAIQFTQRGYYGEGWRSDLFHWVGFREYNGDNKMTVFDPWGALFKNNKNRLKIKKAVRIFISDK